MYRHTSSAGNGSRIRVAAAVAVVLAALLASPGAGAVQTGELAPGFELEMLDGGSLRLEDFRGKSPVYLVFWNSWCAYCVERAQRYEALQERLGDRLKIIAVNTTWGETREEIEAFKERMNVHYAIAIDHEQQVTERYAVKGVPTEFIVGIDGVIRYRDHVPRYLTAHLPDFFEAYRPGSGPALACTP